MTHCILGVLGDNRHCCWPRLDEVINTTSRLAFRYEARASGEMVSSAYKMDVLEI